MVLLHLISLQEHYYNTIFFSSEQYILLFFCGNQQQVSFALSLTCTDPGILQNNSQVDYLREEVQGRGTRRRSFGILLIPFGSPGPKWLL